jgi:hypothetical protein
MIDFEVDSSTLDRLVLDLSATEKQAAKALRSTLNKMAAWVRVRSVKGMSQKLEIQQKVIRRRLKAVKFKTTADGGVAKVWYGLNPVDMIWLGARQTGAGVQASGGRFVAGAFIKSIRGGKQQVFKRRGSARLPIDKQSDAIKTPSEKYLESGLLSSAQFAAQFWKTFEHELQWQTR